MARTSPAKDISHILMLVAAVVVIGTLYFARVILVPLALGHIVQFRADTPWSVSWNAFMFRDFWPYF